MLETGSGAAPTTACTEPHDLIGGREEGGDTHEELWPMPTSYAWASKRVRLPQQADLYSKRGIRHGARVGFGIWVNLVVAVAFKIWVNLGSDFVFAWPGEDGVM